MHLHEGLAPVAPSLRDLDDDMLIKFDNKGDVLDPKYAWHVFKGGKYAQDDSIK